MGIAPFLKLNGTIKAIHILPIVRKHVNSLYLLIKWEYYK